MQKIEGDIIHNKKKNAGITLLEVMLALIIISSIIALSIRQYNTYKQSADLRQMQANVDTIFQAMSDFYKANCYGSYNPAGAVGAGSTTWGQLNPLASPSPSNPFVVTLAATPAQQSLTSYMNAPLPLNSLVNALGGGTNGYVVQFNRHDYPTYVCTAQAVAGTAATGPFPAQGCAAGSIKQKGTVVVWLAQVAVSLKKPALGPQFRSMSGANCLSNISGPSVTPCTSGSYGSGSFLVFERQSTYANFEAATTYWPTKPVVAQFQQLYTTMPSSYLINVAPFQYVYCGG